jgi:hypothetical protein
VGLSSVSLGFRRSFTSAYLGQYMARDRGYLTGTYFFAQRFVLALTGGISHVSFPPSYFADGTPQMPNGIDEARVDAMAFLEYRPGSMFGINATFRYDAELTDVSVPLNQVAGASPTGRVANPNGQVDELQFSRYQAFLGVRWFL